MERKGISQRTTQSKFILILFEASMFSQKSLKIAALCGAFVLGGSLPAEALWPFSSPCGGCQPSPAYGTYTSFYGPTTSYGYNPFAPLVPRSNCGSCRTSFFGFGRNNCGCSPCGIGGCSTGNCATGNCATGNCSLATTTNQQIEPTPDSPPSTYDNETTPMDDRNFGPTPGSDSASTEGTRESHKVPMKVEEANSDGLPMDKTPPVNVKEEEKKSGTEGLEAPKPQTYSAPNLIDPRNSARLEEIQKLEHKITWRKEPVVVRSRPVVRTSRPLVVRKTVRTGGSVDEAPLLTRSVSK